MGRSPCCDKLGLKKGPWTPEEDQKLLAYIDDHGHGNWRALPAKAGLQRCGKSCRLRWTNYLRPDIKRGKFSLQEEQTIIQLHALLGNRWSIIASHLPKRTDNEIKNYWNTHLKKRLAKMGIDPVTHKPENNALAASNGHSKNATNLSHIAQWESARLEAEARLAHQSKLRSNSLQTVDLSRSSSSSAKTRLTHQPSPPPNFLDVPPACHGGGGGERDKAATVTEAAVSGGGCDLESSTSTLSFSENGLPPPPQLSTEGTGEGGAGMFEFMGNSEDAMVKEEGSDDEWKIFGNPTDNLPQYSDGLENSISFPSVIDDLTISMEGFAELLTSSSADRSLSNSDNGGGSGGDGGSDRGGARSDCYEDNKNYWNSILNLANSSPSNSPLL